MAFEHSTGGQSLRGLFDYLQYYGFVDVVLPALLIFALLFGVLQKVKLFQAPKRNEQGAVIPNQFVGDRKINGMVSLLFAFAVVIPHAVGLYPPEYDPVNLINMLLPNTVVMLLAILAVVLVFGLVFSNTQKKFPALQLLFGIIGAVILVLSFLIDVFPAFFPESFDFVREPATQAIGVIVLVMAVVVYFVFREPGTEKLHTRVRSWMEKKVP